MQRLFLAAVALSMTAVAQQSEYFPLQTGNTWVYRVSGRTAAGAQPVTMSVVEEVTMNGVNYWVLTGVPSVGQAVLRYNDAGQLVAYDETKKSEVPWITFAAGRGEEFESRVHPCVSSAQIGERAGKESLPVGTLVNVLEVRYGNFTCADAGVTADSFVPFAGLVKRTETTFAGPRTYELIYARVGGTTVLTQPEHSFTVALDKVQYEAGKPVDILARVAIRNSTSEPLALWFRSSQTYNFVIRDEKKEVVYNWEALRLFAQATRQIPLIGELVWHESFTPGEGLPAGNYTLEAILTTSPERYRATVSFQVR